MAPPSMASTTPSGTNVYEWIGEWYEHGYYAVAPRMDPKGPATGTKRLLKSSSASVDLGFRSLTARDAATVEGSGVLLGIRCGRELP